jgi:hypothetical protein
MGESTGAGSNGRTSAHQQQQQPQSQQQQQYQHQQTSSVHAFPSPDYADDRGSQQHFTPSTTGSTPTPTQHSRHVSARSDASIQRFMDAGRAIGLDDNRLSELLEFNSKSLTIMSPRTPSIPEMEPVLSYKEKEGPIPRIPSPVAEDVVTLGGGAGSSRGWEDQGSVPTDSNSNSNSNSINGRVRTYIHCQLQATRCTHS